MIRITIFSNRVADPRNGGRASVLTASVLNILNRQAIDSKKANTKSIDGEEPKFSLIDLAEGAQNNRKNVENARDVGVQMGKQVLIDERMPSSKAVPMRFQDYIKAMDEIKKGNLSKAVDVFE